MLSFIVTFMAAQFLQQISPQKSFWLPFMQRCLVQIAIALGFTSGSSVLPQTRISCKCLLPLTCLHSVYAGNETVSCRTRRITATVVNSQSPLGFISDVMRH